MSLLWGQSEAEPPELARPSSAAANVGSAASASRPNRGSLLSLATPARPSSAGRCASRSREVVARELLKRPWLRFEPEEEEGVRGPAGARPPVLRRPWVTACLACLRWHDGLLKLASETLTLCNENSKLVRKTSKFDASALGPSRSVMIDHYEVEVCFRVSAQRCIARSQPLEKSRCKP